LLSKFLTYANWIVNYVDEVSLKIFHVIVGFLLILSPFVYNPFTTNTECIWCLGQCFSTIGSQSGTGPLSYKERIYQAVVSQRLRTTSLRSKSMVSDQNICFKFLQPYFHAICKFPCSIYLWTLEFLFKVQGTYYTMLKK
jgi:hypothetical protein